MNEGHLFSPEHWDEILAAADNQDGHHRSWRAERLWSRGYDAWLAGDKERAREFFTKSVLADPGLADGYLGLYAQDSDDGQVCLALGHTAGRLGECQRRFEKKFSIYYFPLFFEPVLVTSPDDARLALCRHLSKTEQFDAANNWLAGCETDDPRTQAMRGRVALAQHLDQEALICFQAVAKNAELQGDALLGMSFALEEMKLYDGAIAALRQAVRAGHKHFRHYVHYRLAQVYATQGNSKRSRKELERLYAEDAGYLDVAALLGLGGDLVQNTDAWAAIVSELESGRVIRDPNIPDNH